MIWVQSLNPQGGKREQTALHCLLTGIYAPHMDGSDLGDREKVLWQSLGIVKIKLFQLLVLPNTIAWLKAGWEDTCVLKGTQHPSGKAWTLSGLHLFFSPLTPLSDFVQQKGKMLHYPNNQTIQSSRSNLGCGVMTTYKLKINSELHAHIRASS